MNKLQVLMLIFITHFSSTLQAQENDVEYIKFNYNISHIICEDVEIIFKKVRVGLSKKEYIIDVKYCKGFKDKERQIISDSIQFNKILKKFGKIKNSDLINNFERPIDGATVTIELGQFYFNSYWPNIKYNLYRLDKYSKNSNLENCLKAIVALLDNARIKINDFNRF